MLIVIAAVGGVPLPANWAPAIAAYPPAGNPALPPALHAQQYIHSFASAQAAYHWIGWMEAQCAGLRFIVLTTTAATIFV